MAKTKSEDKVLSEQELEEKLMSIKNEKLPRLKESYRRMLQKFLNAEGFVPMKVQEKLNKIKEDYISLQNESEQLESLLEDIKRYSEFDESEE